MASEHKRIVRRLDGLEARADRHDIAARLRWASEEKINARLDDIEAALSARLLAPDADDSAAHIELGSRIQRLSERLLALEGLRGEHMAYHDRLEARLSALEAKAEALSSESGTPEPMKRWVIVDGKGSVLTAGDGFVVGAVPAFFNSSADAELVISLLLPMWKCGAKAQEVEVVERDGCIVEACYA